MHAAPNLARRDLGAEIDTTVNMGRDYGDSAINTATSIEKQAANKGEEYLDQTEQSAQYAIDQTQQNTQYALDQTKQNAQYAWDQTQSYSPFSYFSSWWHPESNRVQQIAQNGLDTARDWTRYGMQQGAETLKNINEYQKTALSTLSENVDSFNGYIAEKLYRTADSLPNITIPDFREQLF